jgi:antitoxin MazE
MTRTANLKIQQWGNSLAVRIPSALARSAHFTLGQTIELSLQESGGVDDADGSAEAVISVKISAVRSGKAQWRSDGD